MTRPVDEIPTEELGVARDEARDYRMRVNDALMFVRRTYASLDGYADGGLADAPTAHLREAQEHLAEAGELFKSEQAMVDSRLDAIEDRIDAELEDDR